MKTLNILIKEKREELNLTQEEVANAVGLTRNYISDIENGRYQPSFNTSIKLIKFLGLDLNLLSSMTEIQDITTKKQIKGDTNGNFVRGTKSKY